MINITAVEKVRQLGFDCLSINISLSDIKNMNVRELDYWAEMKRANDAVNKKMTDDIERSRNAR